MPRYDFKCPECGLVFDKFIRNREVNSLDCIDCGSDAPRSNIAAVGFVFGNGKTTGNTGVDSLDSNIDKAIGRDADKRWEAIKDRRTMKRGVQRDNGGEGKVPLRRNPSTGEYEPMKGGDVSRFQNLHSEYTTMYEEHKKKRKEEGVSKFKSDDPYAKYRKKQQQTDEDQ